MASLNTPNLLVIGGTGFIGHHLLRVARQKGWHLTSISLNPPSEERFVDSVRYLHFDLADLSLAKKYIAEDFDFVVNLGGYINHALFQNGGNHLIASQFSNLLNLVEVLPSSRLKRFVQIGSSDEYGNAPAPQNEEFREQPISPYSFAKVASTHFLQMMYRTEGFPAVIIRLFLVYGPGQDNNRFLPQIIQGCLSDKLFQTSAGEQLRDFCFIEDVSRGILMALTNNDVNGEVVNISSGNPVTIYEVIEKVQKKVGKGIPDFGKIPYRTGENMALYADISKAKRLMGWVPNVTLEEGLEKTVDDFQIRIN